jgi:glycyl-tRNA synthetase beta chain
MREHQRYFAVLTKGKGIEAMYIGVSNSLDDNIEEITINHNKVLRARLNDAKFYWLEDLKKPLEERIDELKGVEWHRGLGTVFDKTMRLKKLSFLLCKLLNRGKTDVIKRGAELAKADLVTNMVKDGKEFTKLEGIIGREYALKSNEKKEVADIISEHYFPRFPEDSLPSTIESAIVGVCDRIDTLVGNFLIGEVPTGSLDPFALRRCSNGLIRIIDEFKMRFPFTKIIEEDISLFILQGSISPTINSEETILRLKEFMSIRLETYLTLQGVRYDNTNAVFSVYFDDVYEAIGRIKALNEKRDSKYFERLVIGQRRVANILKGTTTKQKRVKETLFDCKEEKKLWKKFCSIEKEYSESMKQHTYKNSIKLLLSLRDYIDKFFDNCLVMTDDTKIRDNRLTLLSKIKHLFDSFADFSMIVIQGEEGKGG